MNGAINKGNTLPKMAKNELQNEMSGLAPISVNDNGATIATIKLQDIKYVLIILMLAPKMSDTAMAAAAVGANTVTKPP